MPFRDVFDAIDPEAEDFDLAATLARLAAEHDTDMSGAAAGVNAARAETAAVTAEREALKAKNFDLLMQVPAVELKPQTNTDDEPVIRPIEDFFGERKAS